MSAVPRLVSVDDCGCRNFVDDNGRESVKQCSACQELSTHRHETAARDHREAAEAQS